MLPRWDERTRSASRPLCPYLIPRNAAVIIWPMGRQAERLYVAVHVSDSGNGSARERGWGQRRVIFRRAILYACSRSWSKPTALAAIQRNDCW